MQQGDVLLFQTNDNGDITVTNGLVEMSGGLETASYLSLFGGNEDDSNWWGNNDEIDTASQYHSETQELLRSIPSTSGNLIRIKDAAERDLAWFIDKKVASSITVAINIPALNKVKIIITITAQGDESTFEFVENWKISA
ncbi:MAG: phage GP46 family protein [Deltaproteobacteria bacterium]|nr:phage GP46 family protein [Deltaproteobacteria bacterium]